MPDVGRRQSVPDRLRSRSRSRSWRALTCAARVSSFETTWPWASSHCAAAAKIGAEWPERPEPRISALGVTQPGAVNNMHGLCVVEETDG